MNSKMTHLIVGLSAAALLFSASGCASCKPGGNPGKAQAYNVVVKMDPSLAGKSVVVDLIGANGDDLSRVKSYAMSKYWKVNDAFRRDLSPKTLNFVSGNPEQTLPSTDPIWKNWFGRSASYLVVVADLPGLFEDRPGKEDARRQVVELCPCYWDDSVSGKAKTIVVEIKPSGVSVVSPRREGWMSVW